MSHRHPSGRFSSMVACCLLFAASLSAQAILSNGAFLRGEISQENGTIGNDLVVEPRDPSNLTSVGRTSVGPNGGFEFQNIPSGLYELRVTNPHGHLIRREFVTIAENGGFVSVRLPGKEVQRRAAGTVSIAELQHPIRSKARKEFQRSLKADRAGEIQKSVEHLERAIQADPRLMAAHNNLGVRRLSLKEWGRALAEFQKALELEPNSTPVNVNISIALLSLGRYQEAELAARRALESAPNFLKAHYLLGVSLVVQKRGDREAMEHLNKAVSELPKARIARAEILARRGETGQAARDLEEYLRSDKAENRRQIEAWLASLKSLLRLGEARSLQRATRQVDDKSGAVEPAERQQNPGNGRNQ